MTAKEQVESLMNELLGFAEKMLQDYGEFHPFGGYLRPTGAVVHVGVQSGAGERRAQQKVGTLIESFKQLAAQDEAIAFGIATNVTLTRDDGTKGDAISFFLEHQDGYCAEVFFRYEVGFGGPRITDTIAQEGEPLFFKSSN